MSTMVLDKVELRLPLTKEGVLQGIRRILTNENVQRIELDNGLGSIVVWAYTNPTEKLSISDLVLDVPDLFNSVVITELVFDPSERPVVDQALLDIYQEGMYPQAIIVGDEKQFAEAVLFRSIRKLKEGISGYREYFGIPIIQSDLVDPEQQAIVILASKLASVGPAYSTHGYRVILSDQVTQGE